MSTKDLNWESKYRPFRFSEVWGQQSAVAQLSGLIRRNKVEKHIALCGAVGSGKTSLVGVWARAQNCVSNDADGSPCGTCEFCENPEQYFHEYDSAGQPGALDHVQAFVAAKSSRVGRGRTQVVFFDEVHALSRAAQESLLVTIQKAREGLVFCFATTERKGITPALLSRCLCIDIDEFTSDTAFDYLRYIAESEGLSFESNALRLLAAARPPYARDLVIALHGLSVLNERIDLDLVKRQYDLGVYDHLVSYSSALASGDQAEQVRSLTEWNASAVEKIKWIELFVCSTYYNNVIGREYVTDRIIQCLFEARSEFAARIQKRLCLDRRNLEAAFDRMMEFLAAYSHCDEASANIAIVLFGKFVGRDLAKAQQGDSARRALVRPIEDRLQPRLAPLRSERSLPIGDDAKFMQAEHVREIINRSSFFVQHYGTPFDVFTTVEFADAEASLEDRAERALNELIGKLDERYGHMPFGAIASLERDGARVVGRIAAFTNCDEPMRLEAWLHSMISNGGRVNRFSCSEETQDMRFQWLALRDICAGSCNSGQPDKCDLRRQLRISKADQRTPGPLGCKHLFFSNRLSEDAIAIACEPEMPALSAFDRGAFAWLSVGWELKEFIDRCHERERRGTLLARLARRSQDGSQEANSEKQQLLRNWHDQEAERRTRRWRGWW